MVTRTPPRYVPTLTEVVPGTVAARDLPYPAPHGGSFFLPLASTAVKAIPLMPDQDYAWLADLAWRGLAGSCRRHRDPGEVFPAARGAGARTAGAHGSGAHDSVLRPVERTYSSPQSRAITMRRLLIAAPICSCAP